MQKLLQLARWITIVSLSMTTLHPAWAADKINVTTSFSILGDWVRVVGAERVVVTDLVGPDQDAHVFQPKPTDAKRILASQLVVINGLGFEPWMKKLMASAGYKGASVQASQGIKPMKMQGHHSHGAAGGNDHADADPHAWQDLGHAMQYVTNIAQALSQVDPAGANLYQANARRYNQELQALDDWAKQQIATIAPAKRKVITSHDAFGYLAARYGIQFFAPQGLNTEADATAKDVAKLIRQIKKDNIKAVFVENMSNPKLVTQLAKDTGVTLGKPLYADALSAPNQPGATYLAMMRHNITELVAGMAKN
jgi:zinc/manganese transport system substrate-binding protein